MTTRDTPWPAGTPCWVDLMTTDPEAAREFYAQLFGWEMNVGGPEFGGYATALLGGRQAAGIGPYMGEEQNHPPVWSTYLATDDADATSAAVEAAGGTVIVPVMDVMEIGRMGFGQAPSGGVFGYWQSRTHTGVNVANEPNSLTWNEFMTRDYAGAKEFYAKVFGYTYAEMGGDGFDYAMIQLDGKEVGGIGSLPAAVPAAVPPHWRVYFAVADCDAAVARVTELGGSVQRPPTDMPYGRNADVADPQGAMFSVIATAAPA